MGQPIWDYTHACDHDELREALNGRKTSPSEVVNGSKTADCNPLLHRDMMIRLKCTLTKSGRFVNIKSASYKVSIKSFYNVIRFFIIFNDFLGDPFNRSYRLQRRWLSSIIGNRKATCSSI